MTPEQKLRNLLKRELAASKDQQDAVVECVMAHWLPKPVAGTGKVVADAPPPNSGPGGLAD